MKHIKQGKNECFPTVLAMLSGEDINKILADSQAISPIRHSWNDMLYSGVQDESVTAAYKHLARKYAPYLLPYCEPQSGVEIAKQGRFLKYEQWLKLTSSGRGAVILVSRYASRPQAHIAAYENGLIYCGEMLGAVTAKEYWVLMATKSPLCPFAVVSEY